MIFFLILIGLVAGTLAGLLGLGGGIVSVPALYYLLTLEGIPKDHVMHISIATSLASTVLTSTSSSWNHHRKRGVIFPILKRLVPGLLIGCVIGAFLGHLFSTVVLKDIFGVAACLLSVYFFFPKLPPPHFGNKPDKYLIYFGIATGIISMLLGVGGGTLLVPILLGYSIHMKEVVGTSSAGTLATSVFGTVLYIYFGWDMVSLKWSFGYIYLPGVLFIGVVSMITARFGVHLAHRLHTDWIKRIFAIFLAATAIAMLVKN